MKEGKNFKIWGIGYGLIGDIIMALPQLTYFEKKYPDSYKIVVVEKKCSVCAPLLFNHPLIDRVKVTDEWDGIGKEDLQLASQCEIVDIAWTGELGKRKAPFNGSWHKDQFWYNYTDCIDETARVFGINDIKEVLTEDELYPKLYKWFNVGLPDTVANTYSKTHIDTAEQLSNDIAIWPFATGDFGHGRSPTISWWQSLIQELANMGYTISHYGRPSDPQISVHPNYTCRTSLSFLEQVQAALASKMAIGTDSGAMWVMGAYSHPTTTLMTNFLLNHTKNYLALAPVNINGDVLFHENGCEKIPIEDVLTTVGKKVL